MAHYTQEYDRAAKIHSALWREVRPKPAPPVRPTPDPAPSGLPPSDRASSELAPSDRANAFMYRQPDTGAPVSDPLIETGARQSTAPLGPFAQPVSNRAEPGRPEAAPSPTSDSAESTAVNPTSGPLRLAAEATSADVTPPQSQPPWAPPTIRKATASEEGEKLTKLEKRQQDRHGKHGQRALDEEPTLRNETPEPIGTPRKGTNFFGGAGMEGPYIADFVRALEEAGVQHVRAVDPERWSNGMTLDVLAHATETDRDFELTGDADFGDQGEQFNLIGYSYGATQAAQAAADYADRGGKVDHVVLIGAPIGQKLLEELENHPNIGKVIVHNLEDDPIHAGMSKLDLLAATPTLLGQFDKDIETAGDGHFYYGGADVESQQRRDELAKMLFGSGVR